MGELQPGDFVTFVPSGGIPVRLTRYGGTFVRLARAGGRQVTFSRYEGEAITVDRETDLPEDLKQELSYG